MKTFNLLLTILLILLSLINFADNRQQDKIIFRILDSLEDQSNMITGLNEFDAKSISIDITNNEIIIEMLNRLNDLK